MVAPYFKNERPRPMSDRFPVLATPGGITGHKIGDDARMGFVPRVLTPTYVGSTFVFNLIGPINEYLTLQNEQRYYADWAFRQMSVKQILEQSAANLPEGQPFTVSIHNPGMDNEDVVVSPGVNDPKVPSLAEGNDTFGTGSDNRVYTVIGRGKNVQLGSNFVYKSPSNKVHIASVAGPNGLPSQQASPFIHREPHGEVKPHDVLKEGGALPARGDLDRDHPNYHDPKGLGWSTCKK